MCEFVLVSGQQCAAEAVGGEVRRCYQRAGDRGFPSARGLRAGPPIAAAARRQGSGQAGASRPVMVLIEGLDLTGKTTLARMLVAELTGRGIPAVHRRGFLARRHPLDWLLERSAPGDRPRSQALNAAFLFGAVLDRMIAAPHRSRGLGVVLVQESYVDRAVAYGVAAGRWPLAVAAARCPRLFARFDLAVITHAPPAARLERLIARGDGDAVDRLTLTSQAFAGTFDEVLVRVAGRHRMVLRVDTSLRGPQDIVDEIVGDIVPAFRAVASGGPR